MRKIKKSLLFMLPLALILSLIIAIPTGCTKKDLTKIRLNEVVHSIFYAPQYVAISKGFFKDEGLEIDLTTGQGADKTMTALLSGQCDIGFAGPESCIYVYNEGREDYAMVFAQLTQRDGSFLVSRSSEADFQWENTKGKTIIGGRPGGVPQMTLEYILKKHGIEPGKDVNIITNLQFTATAGAFKGGTGDYVALFEPTASALETEDAGYIVASIGKDGGVVPYTAYFATKSYMSENPDIIQKFTNAIYKGQKWVASHTPEEIAKEIKSFFSDTDNEILITVIDRYIEIGAWSQQPAIETDSFNLLQDIMENAGQLDKRVEFEVLIDNQFSEKATTVID